MLLDVAPMLTEAKDRDLFPSSLPQARRLPPLLHPTPLLINLSSTVRIITSFQITPPLHSPKMTRRKREVHIPARLDRLFSLNSLPGLHGMKLLNAHPHLSVHADVMRSAADPEAGRAVGVVEAGERVCEMRSVGVAGGTAWFALGRIWVFDGVYWYLLGCVQQARVGVYWLVRMQDEIDLQEMTDGSR